MTRSKIRDSHAPTSPLHTGSIVVTAADGGGDGGPLAGAYVSIYADSGTSAFDPRAWVRDPGCHVETRRTDERGHALFAGLAPGAYVVVYEHVPPQDPQRVDVRPALADTVKFEPLLEVTTDIEWAGTPADRTPRTRSVMGDPVILHTHFRNDADPALRSKVSLTLPAGSRSLPGEPYRYAFTATRPGRQQVAATVNFGPRADAPPEVAGSASYSVTQEIDAEPAPRTEISGSIDVALSRTGTEATPDYALYRSILASTEAMSFDNYNAYMNKLFFGGGISGVGAEEGHALGALLERRFLPFTDTDSYRLMKVATEAFVMVNCGTILENGTGSGDSFDLYAARRDLPPSGTTPYLVDVNGEGMLPYLAIIRGKMPDTGIGETLRLREADTERWTEVIRRKRMQPCLIELIWSYWLEECGLVQTLNAVTRRFQNVRGPLSPDPLANMEVSPLRPLSNLLWGYIQDEQHRLTIMRRNAEYDHHYGLRLEGRALQGFQPADSRSGFLEAFHQLLRLCAVFYKQDDDTTVKADAFGVLNALKEVHLVLSQGAHGQFGDLPATARIEMLMQQWLLARPELREFLPSRAMVAYPAQWMHSVEAMKKLQGWTDTSVIHFHNLAVFGEQLLLAIRWGAWSTVFEPTQAFNFARVFRPQIQGYIHAYRAATGVELGAVTAEVAPDTTTVPAVLLQRRLAAQRRSA